MNLADHLPVLQLAILAKLSALRQATVGHLAEETDTKPGGISVAATALRAKGLVARQEDQALVITEAGRKALRSHFGLQKQLADEAYSSANANR
jgi:DNA-binding MarR family transcriptional regulator